MLEYLKEVPLFMNLSEEDLQKISDISKLVEFKSDSILFCENDQGDSFYIIVDGSVEVIKKIDNKDVIVSVLKKGDFFGEQALLEGKPRNATIKLNEDCKFLNIGKNLFDNLLNSNVSISIKIMKVIANRMRNEHELIVSKKVEVEEVELKDAKIITFFSSKGGVGKSLLASNLGACLCKNSKTLIIDTELQFGDISWLFNKVDEQTLYELISSNSELNITNISEFLIKIDNKELYLLTAPLKPEQAEAISKQNIIDIITQLKKEFDYIIIDTNSQFNDLSISMLDIADHIIIPVIQNILAVKDAKITLKVLKSLNYSNDKIKVIINMYKESCQIKKENIIASVEVENIFTIPFTEKIEISLNSGNPLYFIEPENSFSNSFEYIKTLISGEKIEKEKGMLNVFKNFYDSVTKWKKVKQNNPKHSSAYIGLGLAYTTKGLLDNAIEEFKKAIEISPDIADGYYNLGIAYIEKELLDDAVVEFKKALDVYPQYAIAKLRLAEVYEKKNKNAEAKELYQQIISENPNTKIADEVTKIINF